MNDFAKGIVSAAILGAVGFAIWFFLLREPARPEPGDEANRAKAPVSDAAGGKAPAVPSQAHPLGGPAVERIQKRGRLLVGTDFGDQDEKGQFEGTPPMFMPGVGGKPPHDGFDVRIAQAIAKDMGVADVEFVHEIYAKLPAKLTAGGDIDLVISGYVPSAKLSGIAWSEPYYDNFGLLLITRRDSGVHSVDDLKGKMVGLFDDEAAEDAVRSFVMGFREPLVRMDSGYLDALLARKFDGFIYDAPYAGPELADWCAEHGRPDLDQCPLFIAQFNLNRMTYNVAVREGEKDLLEAVNVAIRGLRAREDEYRGLVQKYMGKTKSVKLKNLTTKTHTVQHGESLGSIAAKELGNSARWKDLWEANRKSYDNPNLIYPGDELVLP